MMFDKPKTIIEQLPDLTADSFTVRDNDNNVIIDGTSCLNVLIEQYGDYKTRSAVDYLWGLYNATHRADFLKAYLAWVAEYNPLENYNGDETNIYMTSDGAETSTTTHGKTTTTTANDVTNETSVTTFESTTYHPDAKTIQSGSTENTESGTTTVVTDHIEKSLTVNGKTYSADNVHAEIKNRHGNLGVTTSQQMITSEVQMRLYPLIIMYIGNFVSDYCYYVSDFADWWCE